MLALQTVIHKKKQLAEKDFTTIKMIGNWLLSLKSYEETTLKWILSGYIKKTQSNLNLKIGEVKPQVFKCTFQPYDFVISIDKLWESNATLLSVFFVFQFFFLEAVVNVFDYFWEPNSLFSKFCVNCLLIYYFAYCIESALKDVSGAC